MLKKSFYRLRVYQDSTGGLVEVFNDGVVPPNADGSMPILLSDHDVVESVVVTDHV